MASVKYTDSILAYLMDHPGSKLPDIQEATGDEGKISSRMNHLSRSGSVQRKGKRRHYRYSVTEQGRLSQVVYERVMEKRREAGMTVWESSQAFATPEATAAASPPAAAAKEAVQKAPKARALEAVPAVGAEVADLIAAADGRLADRLLQTLLDQLVADLDRARDTAALFKRALAAH